MSSLAFPPLPAGYQLDQQSGNDHAGFPPLPSGYLLDHPPLPPGYQLDHPNGSPVVAKAGGQTSGHGHGHVARGGHTYSDLGSLAMKNPPAWLTWQPEKPQPPQASIGPMPPSGITYPINWLNELEGDVKYGTGATWPGRILKTAGFQGTDSLGMNEAGKNFFGGPLIGPVKLARGTLRRMDPNATPREQLRAFNDQVEGVGQIAAPIAGVTQPEFLPTMAMYGGIQQGTQKGMEYLGADPDVAEGTANLVTLGLPLAKEGMPLFGQAVERNAAPIGQGIGRLTGSPKTSAFATDLFGGGGRFLRRVGETPVLPHEVLGVTLPPPTSEYSYYPDKATARKAFSGKQQEAAKEFFAGATGKTTGFRSESFGNGVQRMQFFSPANNPGYGKLYTQEIDVTGTKIREYKDTLGPNGFIQRKFAEKQSKP